MPLLPLKWLAMIILVPGLVTASPLPDLSERQVDMDCDNPGAIFMGGCWTALNIGDYLYNWNKTTPVCADSTRCCVNDEAWSTCFLRLGRAYAGQNCLSIGDTDCTWQDESIHVDPSIYPQVRYVMKSIYGIHGFFSTYNTALRYGASQAALMITPLTAAIDPKSVTSLAFNLVMIMLSFGLAFLTAPTVALGMLAIEDTAVLYSAQAFALSLQTSPNVAKSMWPTDGSDWSRTVQISQLQTQLQNATGDLAEILDHGLKLLMSDVPTFIAYAQSGAYCNNQTVDLNEKTNNLDYALRTYMTGESLKQNNWYAVPGKISTEAEYKALKNPPCTSSIHGCTDIDVIGKIYWSPVTGRQYSLENNKHPDVTAKSILDQIHSQGWADMPSLFDGAYNCTASGKAGNLNNSIQVNFDGTLSTACLSQLPIYIACGDKCPQGSLIGPDGKCPFGRWEDCTPGNLGGAAIHGGAGQGNLATVPSAVYTPPSTAPPGSVPPGSAPSPTPTPSPSVKKPASGNGQYVAGMVQIH